MLHAFFDKELEKTQVIDVLILIFFLAGFPSKTISFIRSKILCSRAEFG